MKVLVLNAGSSSLKYKLIQTDGYTCLASGHCERVGSEGSFHSFRYPGHDKIHEEIELKTHLDAARLVLSRLVDPEVGVIKFLSCIDAVGHRIVQGADVFKHAAVINDEVLAKISDLSSLAPLHNPAHVHCIKAARELMPDIPHVAVFDTAFHSTMPPESFMYALPYEYYEKYKVRKYGFHGTSHRYVCRQYAKLRGCWDTDINAISCHLGAGGSVCCVKGGKSIDTSMGFTPLDGIMMGSRCGDLDPAVVPYIMEKEDIDPAEINYVLNKLSGFKGVTGVSSDLRRVLDAAEKGNERCKLAIEMYAHRVRKYIGSYYAELHDVDALIFTAGIGENSAYMRELICQDLDHIGIILDKEKNNAYTEGEQIISADDSKIMICVIPTNEEVMIAHDTKDAVLHIEHEENHFI